MNLSFNKKKQKQFQQVFSTVQSADKQELEQDHIEAFKKLVSRNHHLGCKPYKTIDEGNQGGERERYTKFSKLRESSTRNQSSLLQGNPLFFMKDPNKVSVQSLVNRAGPQNLSFNGTNVKQKCQVFKTYLDSNLNRKKIPVRSKNSSSMQGTQPYQSQFPMSK